MGPLVTLLACVALGAAEGKAPPVREQFFSSQDWEWREAEIWLARAGKRGLDQLERTGATSRREMAPRLAEYLSLALLKSVHEEDLAHRPTLHRIAKPYLDRASSLAGPLEAATDYDSGEVGPMPPGMMGPAPGRERRTVASLRDMHGFAVPAAIRLLKSANRFARAYGVELLSGLVATSARTDLQAAADDAAPIPVFHGDYVTTETVGSLARAALQGMAVIRGNQTPEQAAPRVPKPAPGGAVRGGNRVALEIEDYIRAVELWSGPPDGISLLINGIRQRSRAWDAPSWDDWWSAARPVWRLWWENGLPSKPLETRKEMWWRSLLPRLTDPKAVK